MMSVFKILLLFKLIPQAGSCKAKYPSHIICMTDVMIYETLKPCKVMTIKLVFNNLLMTIFEILSCMHNF